MAWSKDRTYRRGSFAHEREELRIQNPLYEKSPGLRGGFEAERCPLNAADRAAQALSDAQRRRESIQRQERREAFMVKRQQPKLVLRPPLTLSQSTDRADFNREWAEEDRASHEAMHLDRELADLKARREQLLQTKEKLKRLHEDNKAALQIGQSEPREGLRQMFKLERQFKAEITPALKKCRTIPERSNDDR